jgi:hypothetical protein
MSTKKEDKETSSKKEETTSPAMPGVVPQTPQDPELAEKGIYQPSDQAANAPAADTGVGVQADPDDKDLHADHAKNLRKLPPVPSERAGAASQAK